MISYPFGIKFYNHRRPVQGDRGIISIYSINAPIHDDNSSSLGFDQPGAASINQYFRKIFWYRDAHFRNSSKTDMAVIILETIGFRTKLNVTIITYSAFFLNPVI